MSLIGNKTLLIFFGEFRTFPVIPKQLMDLDKVDIIFSTWKRIHQWGINYTLPQSDIDLCYKLLPNIKLLLHDDVYFGHEKIYNSSRMYYHWINAINSVEDDTKYDKVLFHRCDMISDWNIILNQEWDSDTLYVATGGPAEIDKFWINDYYLGGDFKTIKKFVNLFKDNNDQMSHFPIGNKILEYNFNWKDLRFRTYLIRKYLKDIISAFNDNNIIFMNENKNSKAVRKFVETYNNNQKTDQSKIDIETFM